MAGLGTKGNGGLRGGHADDRGAWLHRPLIVWRPDSGSAPGRRKRTVSTDAGDGAHGCGERRDVVEHAKRDEVICPTGIVLATLAGPNQDAMA